MRMIGMLRVQGVVLVLSTLSVACGPELGTGSTGGVSGTGGMTDSSTGSEHSDVSSTGSPEGSSSGRSGSPTDAGSTTGAEVCEGEGGQRLDLGYIKLQRPRFLRPNEHVKGEFTCAVASVEETDDFSLSDVLFWITRLQCEGLGELEVAAMQDIDMFDPSWAGRTVTLSASASWVFSFNGWYAVRDEQGELLFASGASLPPAAATAPFTLDWIDLGETCASDFDCLTQYDHLITFTSEADGTLPCYDGGGYETEHYWIEGSTTKYYNPDPFGECHVGDDPSGPQPHHDFRIIRRMGS